MPSAFEVDGVSIETTRVARGGLALEGESVWLPRRHGVDRLRRGDMTESLHPHARGREQRWTFESRPQGRGELEVRVALPGELLASGPHGLRIDLGDGRILMYGAGTWVSGDGERHAVASSWEEGHAVLRVPEDVLERSVYPAVLDPVVGVVEELEASVPRDFSFGGTAFWHRGRPYLMRLVDEGGSRLVPYGVDLATGSVGEPLAPSVEVGLFVPYRHPTLEIAFADGLFDTSTTPWTPILPDVRTVNFVDSGVAVLVREEAGDDRTFSVDWIDPAGTATRVEVATVPIADSSSSDLSCVGAVCLLRFGPDSGGPFEWRRVTIGGSETLTGCPADGGIRAYYSLVFASAGPSGLDVRDDRCGVVGPISQPDGGNNFALEDGRLGDASSSAIRVYSVGGGVETFDLVDGGFALCGPEPRCLIVQADGRHASEVRELDLSVSPFVLSPPIRLIRGTNQQTSAAVAARPEGFLLGYIDDRAHAFDDSWGRARFARLGLDGSVLAASRDLAAATDSMRASSAATSFSLMWSSRPGYSRPPFGSYDVEAGVLGVALATDGSLLDAVVSISVSAIADVGADGAGYLLYGNESVRPYNEAFAPLAPRADLELGSLLSGARVASGEGIHYLATSRLPFEFGDIFGRRLDGVGEPLDADARPLSTESERQDEPDVIFDGSHFLVVWRDHRDDSIRGTRVGADGVPTDAFGVTLSESAYPVSGQPELAFDGAEVMVLYPSGDALVARRILEGAGSGATVVIDSAATGLESYAIAGHAGNFMVAYTAENVEALTRVYLTSVRSGLGGRACTVGADCESGICTAGVCCDRACDGECETCLMAEGAPADGECGPRSAGAVCRESTGECDLAESCDGVSASCPAELPPPAMCVDAGSPDAGSAADGGSTAEDAGSVDAGEPSPDDAGGSPAADAAMPTDSGFGGSDSGSAPDAGMGDSGGGCSAGGASQKGPGALMLLLALVFVRRRRG